MPQCTPVVLYGAIALLSLKQFKGNIEKDILFAGIAYDQHFDYPFVIMIFIFYRNFNH